MLINSVSNKLQTSREAAYCKAISLLITVKILCKLSTVTKRYSSHTILQNFNLPMKQRSLLSTAIH